MKKYFATLSLLALFMLSTTLFGQAGPPDPPGDPGTGGGPVGGSSPIGSGLGIMLALGAAYGAKKISSFLSVQKEDSAEETKRLAGNNK